MDLHCRVSRERAGLLATVCRGMGVSSRRGYQKVFDRSIAEDIIWKKCRQARYTHIVSRITRYMYLVHQTLSQFSLCLSVFIPSLASWCRHGWRLLGLRVIFTDECVGIPPSKRHVHQLLSLQYFEAKKMTPHQVAVFMEERKWDYLGKPL
jgi:hypothetical protein